jgi:DNA invertase Pin-like site-specific DNA recombinase
LVVGKLDRLGRDQRSAINRLHDLQDRGIHIRILDNLVNTKNWLGRVDRSASA